MVKHFKIYIKFSIATLFGVAMLFSCNDNALTKTLKSELELDTIVFPSRVIKRGSMVYTDSGYTKMLLKAPVIEFYEFEEEPYTLFPEGVIMYFYDHEKSDSSGYLQSEWAKMNEHTKLYQAKGNVIVVNIDRDSMLTEEIFWDKKKKSIYNNVPTRIVQKGSQIKSKKGVIASEDFKDFTLRVSKGRVDKKAMK